MKCWILKVQPYSFFKNTLPVRSACVSICVYKIIKNYIFSISCFCHLIYLKQLRTVVLFSVQYEHLFLLFLLNKPTKRDYKKSLLSLGGNNHDTKLPWTIWCVILGFLYVDSFPPFLAVQIYLKLCDFPPSKWITFFLMICELQKIKVSKKNVKYHQCFHLVTATDVNTFQTHL